MVSLNVNFMTICDCLNRVHSLVRNLDERNKAKLSFHWVAIGSIKAYCETSPLLIHISSIHVSPLGRVQAKYFVHTCYLVFYLKKFKK
jgi:hypothetical protein